MDTNQQASDAPAPTLREVLEDAGNWIADAINGSSLESCTDPICLKIKSALASQPTVLVDTIITNHGNRPVREFRISLPYEIDPKESIRVCVTKKETTAFTPRDSHERRHAPWTPT